MMADEVVVGATRRDLTIVLVDAATGLPINMSGPNAAAALQGKSPDTPLVEVDEPMTIVNGADGLVKLSGLGGLLTQDDLNDATVVSSTYPFRVKYTDNAGKVDFTPIFEVIFRSNPLGV